MRTLLLIGAMLATLAPAAVATDLYCVGSYKDGTTTRMEVRLDPPVVNGHPATKESIGVDYQLVYEYENPFGGTQSSKLYIDRQTLKFTLNNHNSNTDVRIYIRGQCEKLEYQI